MQAANEVQISEESPWVIKRGPRVQREACALAACRCKGVVPILSFNETELTLPLVVGTTLQGRLAEGPLSAVDTYQLAAALMTTLADIHARGWVHNDISPSNILLTAGGPMLIDFDAASQRDSTPHLFGTIHYMAPERFDGQSPSPESDLYSLGITLFEAVTGRLPFDAVTTAEIITAHHRHLFLDITALRPDLPSDLARMIVKLTSRLPADRVLLCPMLPLEDLHTDVVGKAQRGQKLDDSTLAAKAGITLEQLAATKAGESLDQLFALAGALGLHGPSLLAMARSEWRPAPVSLLGLEQFNTPFDDMTVNAYIVFDPITKQAAAFDTGATAQPMVDFVKAQGLTLTHLFITHTHPDHIADIASLVAVNPGVQVLSNSAEPAPKSTTFDIETHPSWSIGGLTVEPRLTTGHSKGGISYVISGLTQPVAIVGDALFASSMGGGMVSYADALATNRAQLFTLPDNTIVCPGHGPLTTIGEEKQHNPFYPEYKH